MKLHFRSISGKYYTKIFSDDALVHDACCFLAKRLHINNNQIFLIRPDQEVNLFYSNSEKIQNIIKENGSTVVFFSFDDSYKIPFSPKMIYPPKSTIKSFINFQLIKSVGIEERFFYTHYANIIRNVPADLHDRVNEVAQLGYDINDCQEALRASDYNVNMAIQYLVSRNSRNEIILENFEESLYYGILDSDYDVSDISSSSMSDEFEFELPPTQDNKLNVEAKHEDESEVQKDLCITTKDSNKKIIESLKCKFFYHLTLRRKPPSKFNTRKVPK